VSTLAERTLADHLPLVSSEDRTLDLFAQWEAEDSTDDPDEIACRNCEWEEMKRHLEASDYDNTNG